MSDPLHNWSFMLQENLHMTGTGAMQKQNSILLHYATHDTLWSMVTEYCVWRKILKCCVWRLILKHCVWRVISKHCARRPSGARQTPVRRPPDARQTPALFCIMLLAPWLFWPPFSQLPKTPYGVSFCCQWRSVRIKFLHMHEIHVRTVFAWCC